jgi:protein-tyrosine phosphatase
MTETQIKNAPWIELEGAFNVRDVGGYPAADGLIRTNALLRADSLHKLTPADQQILLDYGVRAVIDLRHASEVNSAANVFAQSSDVNYHTVPIFEGQPEAANPENADLAAIYRYMVDQCQQGLVKALQTIARAPEGAVLVHCTAGKDRTGVVTALALAAVGVSQEVIVEEYALTTEAMKRLRPRLLGNPDIKPEMIPYIEKMLGSEPELMETLLAYIDEKYGGTDHYLNQIGISSTDLDLLSARLIQNN